MKRIPPASSSHPGTVVSGADKDRVVRVLRVIARLNIGGPAIQAVTLTRELQGDGFASLLVCGDVESHEGDMSYLARAQGVRPYKVRGLGREIHPIKDLGVLVRLLAILRRFRPHILHTHTAKAGTLGRVAGLLWNAFHPKKKRVRLVHTFHGHVFHSYFGWWKTRFFLGIERLLARFTQRIVVISPAQKRDICHRYRIAPPGKVEIIRLGFHLAPFARGAREGGQERDGSFKVGIVGRLAPVKNHRLLLKAVARLGKQGRLGGMRFVVVGDGELRQTLEQETERLGIGPVVDYVGWRKDMAAVYADLDAVALTSFNEGTPVSLIEAMAAARPIVATAVGGVPDLLGRVVETWGGRVRRAERGLLVPSEDDLALSRALTAMARRRQEIAEMGRCAKDYALATYGMERLVNDLKSLYEGLASRND